MAAGGGGAPGAGGTQDTRVQRIEEGIPGLQTESGENSIFDANWPNYPMTPASLTTSLTGTNNDLVYTAAAQYGGAIGNSISVAYVDPAGNNKSLAVSVSGYTITVNLATGVAGAITSTATQIATAIRAHAQASQLVTVANAGGNDGSGVVTAMAATKLSGGTASTFGQFDAGRAAGVEPATQVAQVDTQWENNGITPWDALKFADPTKW